MQPSQADNRCSAAAVTLRELPALLKRGPTLHVMGATKFRRFFRAAAGLRVDDNDLKRYSDFVNDKLADLLVVGRAAAKASGRDVILAHDLPITKGLQQCIHEFERLGEEPELEPLLADIAAIPPMRGELSDEVMAKVPVIVGGLSLAMARTFRIVAPKRTNPGSAEWQDVFAIFDLLL